MPPWPRVLRALFVAYVAATAIHIGVVVFHEPFAFDAWNVALDTKAEPITLGRFAHYVVGQYTHSNPRIGQPITYLAYKLAWFSVIATPLVWLGLALAVVVLGLGRWPSWRRGRDLALYAIALGFAWFAMPQIGKTMFCRAYCANYLYGALIQLWFLVPLRLARGAPSRRALIGYAVLGVAAGMCNEHTGPTLVAFMLGYALWRHRRDGARPTLVWAGAAGVMLGFAAIFFAPGQGQRYDGLAQKVSLVGRLLQRGVITNFEIFRDFLTAAMPVLVVLTLALIIDAVRGGASDDEVRAARRQAFTLVGLALAAGTLITVTVFVSPKLGPRFYLHAMALLLAGFIAVADVVLTSPRRLAPFVALAVAASGYAAARTIPLYLRLAEASAARLAALEATPRGAVFTATAWEQVTDNWWFLGDDFRDVKKREMITTYFDLKGVIFRAVDIEAPLAVSDVRLVPRYEVSPATCLDEHGGLELGAYRGIDVGSIQKAEVAAIAELIERLGPAAHLSKLDLEVQFVGAPPPLPRPHLIVGRWTPTRFEAYAGAINRRGHSTTRDVALPKELRAQDLEILLYQVGGETRRLGTSRDAELAYVPWATGAYWVLACRAQECFVVVATRH
jgi:hypothetical protein